MGIDEFSKILDALQGKTKFLYYHLMGEPLTHPELTRFLTLAKKCEFKSVLTTNGTLLDKRGAEIIRAGVHKVSISVHSFEDGTEEDFLRYMGKIITFSELASRDGVIVVLRLWNKGHDNGLNDKVYAVLRERLVGEWAENTRGIRIRDKLHLEWGDRFAWPDLDEEDCGDRMTCYGLNDHFGILADGTVVPCCMDSDGVINLGNIFTDDLDEVLNSPRAVAIKDGFSAHRATEALCRKCGYARRFK